jgi:hypothetical protein
MLNSGVKVAINATTSGAQAVSFLFAAIEIRFGQDHLNPYLSVTCHVIVLSGRIRELGVKCCLDACGHLYESF